eukprot:TRINITY_DN6386_c0_g1_i7.p1 TRINITY_DN6386_c0_g1~~TRINITY_DN6386_c0_g1_i7.p1  ORF type:complete len:117 (-),score=11.43 TRINITY_DN6386_c0_g1_i7:338-688(-)
MAVTSGSWRAWFQPAARQHPSGSTGLQVHVQQRYQQQVHVQPTFLVPDEHIPEPCAPRKPRSLLEAFVSAPDKVAREQLLLSQVAAHKPRTQTAPGRWHVRPRSDCGRIEMDSQEL